MNDVVPIDTLPEPEPEDPLTVVMRLFELEAEVRRREEERILERFFIARIDEEEGELQLTIVARCSGPYAYLDDPVSHEEEED